MITRLLKPFALLTYTLVFYVVINCASARVSKGQSSQWYTQPSSNLGSASDYYVDGSSIPGLTFAIGDTYAGLLPAGDDSSKDLFFWYHPALTNTGDDALTIWLEGGYWCSALTGALQGMGPFNVLYDSQGVATPNEYDWAQLSHIVYVDAFAGVGFSQGAAPKDYVEGARDFHKFLVNLMTVFPQMQSKKLRFAGRSSASTYIYFFALELLYTDSSTFPYPIDYQGFTFFDADFSYFGVIDFAPAPDFAAKYQQELGLNDSFVAQLLEEAQQHNYSNVISANLVYPSSDGNFVDSQLGNWDQQGWDPYDELLQACAEANPCFSNLNFDYQCPRIVDPLGSDPFIGVTEADPDNWVNDVLKPVLHVDPSVQWLECSPVFTNANPNDPSAISNRIHFLLDRPINDKSRNLIISAEKDPQVLADGTALVIQFLTWGNVTGLVKEPLLPFTVGGMQKGRYSDERGLTYLRGVEAGSLVYLDAPDVVFAAQKYALGQTIYS